jgi:hypothetical protein
MKLFTLHLPPAAAGSVPVTRAAAAPLLLREGFSLGAALFGPLWCLADRLWLEAALLAALWAALSLAPEAVAAPASLALAALTGLEARDRLRARLARQGWRLAGVIAAPDIDAAWFRLATLRPELVRGLP